ncbi:30S ribosomal protein S17 [Candidatus Microgenomates bacterium]|nr:30S ribosomal protein S17 [Candidatus Microgenomates bacterium]
MKKLQGNVIAHKMVSTAVVRVERWVVHPLYKKRLRRSKKYHAHDELGASVGDTVVIQEVRPLSKTKRWKIIEIVNKSIADGRQSTAERKKTTVVRRRSTVSK